MRKHNRPNGAVSVVAGSTGSSAQTITDSSRSSLGLEVEDKDCLELENLSLKFTLVKQNADNQLAQLNQAIGALREKIYRKANLSQEEWGIDLNKRRFVKNAPRPQLAPRPGRPEPVTANK